MNLNGDKYYYKQPSSCFIKQELLIQRLKKQTSGFYL